MPTLCYRSHMSLLDNKKVYFNYEITEKIEAGLDLLGAEVKSLRAGHGSLDGSYVSIKHGEAFLVGANIPNYQPNNPSSQFDSKRDRRLLLTQTELGHLIGIQKEKGLTIVPLSVYNKKRYIKLGIGVARGKKKYDKREVIKKRDTGREIMRSLKIN